MPAQCVDNKFVVKNTIVNFSDVIINAWLKRFTVTMFTCEAINNDVVLSTEWIGAMCTCLQDLNDYCLLDIFSRKSLALMDLCSLAETCKRFKHIAQRVFPIDFHIEVTSSKHVYIYKSENILQSFYRVNDVARILKNFGSYLYSLAMIGNDPVVIYLVMKYCNDGTLKRISIHNSGIIEDVSVACKSILKHIVSLAFYETYMDFPLNCVPITLNCELLTDLKIDNVDYWSAVLKNTFPLLERFTCTQRCYYKMNRKEVGDVIVKFIARHNNITKLYLSGCTLFREDLLFTISNVCKELRELTLLTTNKDVSIDFSQLYNLTKLKTLEVNFALKNLNVLFNGTEFTSLKILENLKLYYVDITSEITHWLSQLQNLRELHLICCNPYSIEWTKLSQISRLYLFDNSFCISYAPTIILLMPNLVELSILNIYNESELTAKIYNKIVKILDLNPNRIVTIICKINDSLYRNSYESQQIRLVKV